MQADLVTQEEALANADSATNVPWLINTRPDSKAEQEQAKPAEPDGPSFTEFTWIVDLTGGDLSPEAAAIARRLACI